jgi:hypothetical protein
MAPFDPMLMGRVLERLDQQDEEIAEIKKDVRSLLEMANRGRGGLCVIMSVAGVLGTVGGWIAEHFWRS